MMPAGTKYRMRATLFVTLKFLEIDSPIMERLDSGVLLKELNYSHPD